MSSFPPQNTPSQNATGNELLKQKLAQGKVLLGMVHLTALPGSPRAASRAASDVLAEVLESARRDARAILEGGMDGFIIENFGDTPFYPREVPSITVAGMSLIASHLAAEARSYSASQGGPPPFIGVNVLRNDARAALAIAAAAGLDGLRVNVHSGAMVTDQGIVEGQAHETLRDRARWRSEVAILADILVKHAVPLGAHEVDPASAARDTAYRGLADAIIVSGRETGGAVDLGRLEKVREAIPDIPLLVGSGVTAETAREGLSQADGAIIGTALKVGGDVQAAVDRTRVREIVRGVHGG